MSVMSPAATMGDSVTAAGMKPTAMKSVTAAAVGIAAVGIATMGIATMGIATMVATVGVTASADNENAIGSV